MELFDCGLKCLDLHLMLVECIVVVRSFLRIELANLPGIVLELVNGACSGIW